MTQRELELERELFEIEKKAFEIEKKQLEQMKAQKAEEDYSTQLLEKLRKIAGLK